MYKLQVIGYLIKLEIDLKEKDHNYNTPDLLLQQISVCLEKIRTIK